jgi:hypothetical protein
MRFIIKPTASNGEPEFFIMETCNPLEEPYTKHKLIARTTEKNVAELICDLLNRNVAGC